MTHSPPAPNLNTMYTKKHTKKLSWHQILGHPCAEYLYKASQSIKWIPQFKSITTILNTCPTCICSKQTKAHQKHQSMQKSKAIPPASKHCNLLVLNMLNNLIKISPLTSVSLVCRPVTPPKEKTVKESLAKHVGHLWLITSQEWNMVIPAFQKVLLFSGLLISLRNIARSVMASMYTSIKGVNSSGTQK